MKKEPGTDNTDKDGKSGGKEDEDKDKNAVEGEVTTEESDKPSGGDDAQLEGVVESEPVETANPFLDEEEDPSTASNPSGAETAAPPPAESSQAEDNSALVDEPATDATATTGDDAQVEKASEVGSAELAPAAEEVAATEPAAAAVPSSSSSSEPQTYSSKDNANHGETGDVAGAAATPTDTAKSQGADAPAPDPALAGANDGGASAVTDAEDILSSSTSKMEEGDEKFKDIIAESQIDNIFN